MILILFLIYKGERSKNEKDMEYSDEESNEEKRAE